MLCGDLSCEIFFDKYNYRRYWVTLNGQHLGNAGLSTFATQNGQQLLDFSGATGIKLCSDKLHLWQVFLLKSLILMETSVFWCLGMPDGCIYTYKAMLLYCVYQALPTLPSLIVARDCKYVCSGPSGTVSGVSQTFAVV